MFLQIESTLAENNISSRDVRKNLLFLAENKDLPLKVRQEILGAIETFLITTIICGPHSVCNNLLNE